MAGCSSCSCDKSEGLVGCEGSGEKWFHYSCVGLTNVEFGMLSKSKNLFFLCNECMRKCGIVVKINVASYTEKLTTLNKDVSNISVQVHQHVDAAFLVSLLQTLDRLKSDAFNLIKAEVEKIIEASIGKLVTLKIDELKPKFDNLSPSICHTAPIKSYAFAAAVTPLFIIKPVNKQPVATTKFDMLQSINPVSSSINLSKVRNIKDGCLVISCDSINDSKKFKELATKKLLNKYVVEKLATLHPRVKVVGITEEMDADRILNFLKLQHKSIITPNSNCKVLSVTHLKKK